MPEILKKKDLQKYIYILYIYFEMRNNKDYYEQNKEKYKQYYQENKEFILKREQLYYQTHQAEIRIKQKIYFRKYYLLNKETIIENVQRRLRCSIENPDKLCNQIINSNIIISLN